MNINDFQGIRLQLYRIQMSTVGWNGIKRRKTIALRKVCFGKKG